jgi:hypothetical protein
MKKTSSPYAPCCEIDGYEEGGLLFMNRGGESIFAGASPIKPRRSLTQKTGLLTAVIAVS